MMATEYADRSKPEDEPRLGMSAFHLDFEKFLDRGKLKTRLVFSVQILLDIKNFLYPPGTEDSPQTDKKRFRYTKVLRYVQSQQLNLSTEITKIDDHGGPLGLKKSFALFIRHVDNWIEFGGHQPNEEWKEMNFPEVKEDFLAENPWHFGLVFAEGISLCSPLAPYQTIDDQR